MTSLDRTPTPGQLESDLFCFSTTSTVSFVDARMPGQLVLAIEHNQPFDRSLEVSSFEIDHGEP